MQKLQSDVSPYSLKSVILGGLGPFGSLFMIIPSMFNLPPGLVVQSFLSGMVALFLMLMPLVGALMLGMTLSSFFQTSVRHAQEIDLLRKELDSLKTEKS